MPSDVLKSLGEITKTIARVPMIYATIISTVANSIAIGNCFCGIFHFRNKRGLKVQHLQVQYLHPQETGDYAY